MWASKCALSLFLGIQVALGQDERYRQGTGSDSDQITLNTTHDKISKLFVPEPLLKHVNPAEGSRGSALHDPSKVLALGTTQLSHLGALTQHGNRRGAGETGMVSNSQHRQLQSEIPFLAIDKPEGEMCLASTLGVVGVVSLPPGVFPAALQIWIIRTFTYADGTTGSGTSIVDINATATFGFYFELSVDEANDDGYICDGCDFVLTAGECVSNCDAYDSIEMVTGSIATDPIIPACPCGADMCDDPHMQGLSGQHIDWSGVDGNWYNLVADDDAGLHVNLRLTAPLPVEFPNRQLVTGLSILSEGHSLIIEVTKPYSTATDGCPQSVLPCLADGGLVIRVDGREATGLLRPTRNEVVVDGVMTLSASNLPVECRQFGGDKIWARMYDEMTQGQRKLEDGTFEDWVMHFSAAMAAPGWCAKYIAENGLGHVQSNHALFKIDTPTVAIRLHVGVNHQGDGELDWDGSVLPDLDFWQMNVGLDGLNAMNPSLSGVLGETARPVVDGEGRNVMEGPGAMRGTVEDYRVSDALGTDFNMLHM